MARINRINRTDRSDKHPAEDAAPLEQCGEGGLFALNDILTSHLAERYGWYADDDERAAALDDLTHQLATSLDDLLERLPVRQGNPSHED